MNDSVLIAGNVERGTIFAQYLQRNPRKGEELMLRFTRLTRLAGFGLLGALAVLSPPNAVTPSAALAAAPQAAQAPSPNATKPDQNMATMGQNMMAMRQKMMADDKEADARLQQLIGKMNAAKGDAKVEAVAAVVTELVNQRAATRERMNQMSPMMMNMMMMNSMMQR